ncbi:hypothetical protein QYM36_006391, partial [Artemia franciscana]
VGSPIAQVASPSQDYPHARQESTDSGLGMTANYSMPHTPEDFLASIDDTMDHSIDTDLNGPSSVNNADMVETSMPAAMDTTDDLVPTLETYRIIANCSKCEPSIKLKATFIKYVQMERSKDSKEESAKSASEYAEKVRQFMIESYIWQNTVYAAASRKLFGNTPNPQLFAPSYPSTTLPEQERNDARIYTLAPLWKRFVAEVIDIAVVLLLKVLLLIVAFENIETLEDQIPDIKDLDTFLEFLDYDSGYKIFSNLFFLDFLQSLLGCLFEAMFLAYKNGQTLGKAVMRLRVVRCETATLVHSDTVSVISGRGPNTLGYHERRKKKQEENRGD